MTEKDIEAKLRDRVKEIGGIAYKFVSPGHNGVPDRLIGLPGGRVVFVELKAPGKKSRPLQKAQQRILKNLGFLVFEDVDSIEKIDYLIEICKTIMTDDSYYELYNRASLKKRSFWNADQWKEGKSDVV